MTKMGPKTTGLTSKQVAYMLWEAALHGWNKEDGDKVVTFRAFDTFLIMCDFKGWATRDMHRRRMKALGLIDYPEGWSRGKPKEVTIHVEPTEANLLPAIETTTGEEE